MTNVSPASLPKAGLTAHHRRASLSSLQETFLSSEWCASPSASSSTAVLGDWAYWQRDGSRNPHCWTKVFAVLRREFLWLFQRQESAPRSVLVQLAVARVSTVGPRHLRISDPSGEDVDLWLLRDDAAESWLSALEDAAAATREFLGANPRAAQLSALPRESFYRGTLTELRRVTHRERCLRVVHKVADCWRRRLLGGQRGAITDGSEAPAA